MYYCYLFSYEFCLVGMIEGAEFAFAWSVAYTYDTDFRCGVGGDVDACGWLVTLLCYNSC